MFCGNLGAKCPVIISPYCTCTYLSMNEECFSHFLLYHAIDDYSYNVYYDISRYLAGEQSLTYSSFLHCPLHIGEGEDSIKLSLHFTTISITFYFWSGCFLLCTKWSYFGLPPIKKKWQIIKHKKFKKQPVI